MRLRKLRSSLDLLEAKDIAKALGIGLTALYSYERGEREPTAPTLAAYATKFGVDPSWLLTGKGQMFAVRSKVSNKFETHRIDKTVFKQVGRLVLRIYKEEGVKLPPDALLDEQSEAYNSLIARAEDPGSQDELISLLPWLEARLRRGLMVAVAEPGTGKHQA